MNFYGAESRDEHTIAGRLIPLLEAFDIAIKQAANQPLPQKNHSVQLPVWCHSICDQFTKTIFKKMVGLAPQGKFDPRSYGRCVGMLLRGATFFSKEAPAQMKREGLSNLSPDKEEKLNQMAGFESLFQLASDRFQKPINNKDALIETSAAQFDGWFEHLMKHVGVVISFLMNRSAQEQHQFLCGIPEGFVGLLDTEGDFAGRSKRGEVYLLLLIHWPEIAEMQKTQPPKTRRDLLEWLEEREGAQLVGDQKQFNELYEDIELDLAPPGRPQRADSE